MTSFDIVHFIQRIFINNQKNIKIVNFIIK